MKARAWGNRPHHPRQIVIGTNPLESDLVIKHQVLRWSSSLTWGASFHLTGENGHVHIGACHSARL